MQYASGLNVVIGLWLVMSPSVLDYAAGDPTWSTIICGGVVAAMALARLGGAFHATWMSVVNIVVGIWLLASAFWAAVSVQAVCNVAIAGALIVVLAAWSASARPDAGPGDGDEDRVEQ